MICIKMGRQFSTLRCMDGGMDEQAHVRQGASCPSCLTQTCLSFKSTDSYKPNGTTTEHNHSKITNIKSKPPSSTSRVSNGSISFDRLSSSQQQLARTRSSKKQRKTASSSSLSSCCCRTAAAPASHHQQLEVELNTKENLRCRQQTTDDDDSPRSGGFLLNPSTTTVITTTTNNNKHIDESSHNSSSETNSQTNLVNNSTSPHEESHQERNSSPLPSVGTSPSPQLPPVGNSPSPQLPSVGTSPSPQLPSVGTSPSPQLPSVGTSPSPQLPSVGTSPSPQLPSVGTSPSPQLPSVGTSPSPQLPSVRISPSPQLPSVGNSPSPQLPSVDDCQEEMEENMNNLNIEHPNKVDDRRNDVVESKDDNDEDSSSSKLICRFRDLVKDETIVLNELIEKWKLELKIAEENDHCPTEACDDIRAVIGKTGLIIAQRFTQFLQLVDQADGKPSMKKSNHNRPVFESDLDGFWEMDYIQVKKVKDSFTQLEERKKNGWETPTIIIPTTQTKKKRRTPKKNETPTKTPTLSPDAIARRQAAELERKNRMKKMREMKRQQMMKKPQENEFTISFSDKQPSSVEQQQDVVDDCKVDIINTTDKHIFNHLKGDGDHAAISLHTTTLVG